MATAKVEIARMNLPFRQLFNVGSKSNGRHQSRRLQIMWDSRIQVGVDLTLVVQRRADDADPPLSDQLEKIVARIVEHIERCLIKQDMIHLLRQAAR